MIKKFKEFVEEGFMKTVSQIANGDVIRDEDNPTNIIKEFMFNHEIEDYDYTINKDFSVDVKGNVDIIKKDLINGQLPFKFGKVSGYFDCSYSQLTSLKGCPQKVCYFFNCSSNELTSLEGCPTEVGGGFDCSKNQLTSLEGCPQKVGDYFYCDRNEKQFTEEEVRSLCNVKWKIKY